MNPTTYTPGQTIQILMIEPKRGRFPMAKAPNGMVCKIQQPDPNTKPWYQYGATWEAMVVEVRPNMMVVTPLSLIRTAEENANYVIIRPFV